MKNVLVTGGTNGIGKAVSELFSQNGYRVFIIYNNDDESAVKMEKATVFKAFKADVSDYEQVNKAVDEIIKLCGHIDILVNNAGIAQQKLFIDLTPDEWKRMIDVNLNGVFNVTHCVVKNMLSNGGSIVNVSSVWGRVGASCEVHYSAAKAGIIGFTKALAKELALSKIRVNSIAPGMIATRMNSSFSDEDLKEITDTIPMNRTGTPEECAKAVFFLSGDDASYITGQTIGTDGGLVM